MKSEPILILKNGEIITSMVYDDAKGFVLLGTSEGRILLVKKLGLNAFMMGNRTIYASVTGGAGIEIEAQPKNIRYGLMDRIFEITSGHQITRWKSFDNPSGIDVHTTNVGTFTTPVLWAGENFGWWGDISWSQVIPAGCRVVIQIRAGGSTEGVLSAVWKTFEETTSGNITKSLDEIAIAGSYAQVKVYLESPAATVNPQVSNLILPFLAKHVSYFFTVKMAMEKGTNIKGGMLVGLVSTPANTEVKWGVTNSPSVNWNDYIEVTPGKIFALPEGFGDRIKVGAKMIVYDNEVYPSIDEFALTFDSDIDNLIGTL
jgi:hypothetical protein